MLEGKEKENHQFEEIQQVLKSDSDNDDSIK
jgi:hypothetical protein